MSSRNTKQKTSTKPDRPSENPTTQHTNEVVAAINLLRSDIKLQNERLLDGITEVVESIKPLMVQFVQLSTRGVDHLTDLQSKIVHTTNTNSDQMSKIDEVIDLNKKMLEDKKQHLLDERCHKLKKELQTIIKEHFEYKKASVLEPVKNSSKTKLYSKWANANEIYLPLKFRPKYIRNEDPNSCSKETRLSPRLIPQ